MTVAPNPHRSLLERLRRQPEDAEAWQRLDALYRPVLHSWLRRYCLQPQDADDLVQQVFEVVLRKLPEYDSEKGTFRGWLRGILGNSLQEFWRSQEARHRTPGDDPAYGKILDEIPNHGSDPRRVRERGAQNVTQRLLARIQPDFSITTWRVFQRLLEGEKAADVAAALGISLNAVYLAKSSILKRLRQELETLSD